MSTACGGPQGGGGWLLWTHVNRGRGGTKIRVLCGSHKWVTPNHGCFLKAVVGSTHGILYS